MKRNREIEKQLPDYIQKMIRHLMITSVMDRTHYPQESVALECEIKDLEREGEITKEQAFYVKRKYLYGDNWNG